MGSGKEEQLSLNNLGIDGLGCESLKARYD